MAASLTNQLVVALSSRALFDFEAENKVFEDGDDSAYMALQLSRLDEIANPGCAFPLVKKLLALNTPEEQRVEVVIVSRNDPVSGLRIFRSAEHHELNLTRGVFTRGAPPTVISSRLEPSCFCLPTSMTSEQPWKQDSQPPVYSLNR